MDFRNRVNYSLINLYINLMKKIISFILFLILIALPANSLFAADASVSFLNALGNLSKIEDYKMMQAFNGNVEFEDGADHLNVEYRISLNSAVNGGDSMASFNKVNVFLKFTNLNAATESAPFKEMTMQAGGEITSLNQQDIYGRLTSFNVGLKDPLPAALDDIDGMKTMVNQFKGIWFHSDVTKLTSGALESKSGQEIDVNKYLDFEKQFKEDPKEAILELSKLAMKDSDSGLSEEEMDQAVNGIKLLLETRLFTVRDMAGENSGSRFFNLNRESIIGFLRQFATLVGEELTANDELSVRSVLSKISVAGSYHVDDVYGLIDSFLIRFKIRETGPIKNFELNYRFKVSSLNQPSTIETPTNFEEADSFFGDEVVPTEVTPAGQL